MKLQAFLLLHHFPDNTITVFIGDVDGVDPLRQPFQVDFIGVLRGLHQMAQSVVDPHICDERGRW